MKRIYLFLNFILFSIFIYGQLNINTNKINYIDILKADTLTKGIYNNFFEFIKNCPTIKNEFRSDEEYLPINSVYNNMHVNRLRILDSNNLFVPFTNSHWGICDGRHAYINFKGKYQKISIDGKYSHFVASIDNDTYGLPTSEFDYLIDVTNGYLIQMNVSSVKELLKRESVSLYQEFKNENSKKLMMYSYIKRLNQCYE